MIVWVYLLLIKTSESPFLTFLPRSCLVSLKRRVYHCGKSVRGRKLLPETTRIAKESRTLQKEDLMWMMRCAVSVWWKLPWLHNGNRVTADPLKDVALRAGVAASSLCQRDCANFSVTRKRAELSQWPSAFCLEKNPVHSPFCCSGKVFFVHPVRAVQRGCCWEKDWNRWGRRENCDGEITENYWRAREDRLLLPSAVFIELFPPCQKQPGC